MIAIDFETDVPILREARQAVPEMSIVLESERAAAGDGADEPIRLLFWASGGDFVAFEAALEDDATVARPTVLRDGEDRRLYRVFLTDEGMAVSAYDTWVAVDATVVSGETTDEGWAFRMQFPDRAAVAEFRSWFEERDLRFDVSRLRSVGDDGDADDGGPDLTSLQRETLLRAWQNGYFEVPRKTTLVELASQVDITDAALSQRLRRGISRLIEYAVDDGVDEA